MQNRYSSGVETPIPDLSRHRHHYGVVVARPGKPSIVAVWQQGSTVIGIHATGYGMEDWRAGRIVSVSLEPGAAVGDWAGVLVAEGWTQCRLRAFTLPANGLIGIAPTREPSALNNCLYRLEDAPHNVADEGGAGERTAEIGICRAPSIRAPK